MIADLSGYTALGEKLLEKPGGAELLSNVVNELFGRMVEITMAHGGDVIKFAGDALLCTFEPVEQQNATDEQVALVGLEALRCTVALDEFVQSWVSSIFFMT